MKTNNLILTISIGDQYNKIASITHDSIRNYSCKINADFLCIDECKISQTTPHWEKFQTYDLFNIYDRILYLDTDIIIRDDCPNLFDIVPKNSIGLFNEEPYTDRSKELLIDTCKQYGTTLPYWNNQYYNTGVMLIPSKYRNIFKKPEKEICNFYEQSYINMVIAKENPSIHDITYKFNRMTCMDFIGEDRFDSYVIHYAGYPNLDFILDLIPKDLERWKKDKESGYKYKKHIHVKVTGGLGDQVDAEPSVRYLAETLCKDDDLIISSHWPEIFKHIKNIKLYNHNAVEYSYDTPYYVVESLPEPNTPMWSMVSNLLCHTVNFCSMSILKRELTNEEKQIKLTFSEEDINEVNKLVNFENIEDYITIHPGKHWETKTLPLEWWQELIDLLSVNNKLIIIGDNGMDRLRGVLNVKCPENSIDLRNKLLLNELFYLLSKSKILISNDSAPIHIAGAFDNSIALIPTCKHPDHILPYRNGSTEYKTISFYKKLVLDDFESRPTQILPILGDKLPEGKSWNDYLADPSEIVEILNETLL